MAEMPTSIVHATIVRAAGPVEGIVDSTFPGTPEAQVSVRISDVLCYVHNAETTAAIRRIWEDAARAAADRLAFRVSRTWLGAQPGNYPLGVLARYATPPEGRVTYHPRNDTLHLPRLVRVTVGSIVWMVLDQQAAHRILGCWRDAERHWD